MSIDDAIDTILISLSRLLNEEKIKREDILNNSSIFLKLYPEKYKSLEDYLKRLKFLQAMNIENKEMSISDNHKLVLEIFDKFNELTQNKLDAYYTGGLMRYIATGHALERYHGDLDLFINENQLLVLKELIDLSDDFEFVSNMNHKDINGHEYKITYKNTSISIGLFLFERKVDQSIVIKRYYYLNQDPNEQLLVDEKHFSKKYTDLSFSDIVREHNGYAYKCMSLESIYDSKKGVRPKDVYDANIIEKYINHEKVAELAIEKEDCYQVRYKAVRTSVISAIEDIFNTTPVSTIKK